MSPAFGGPRYTGKRRADVLRGQVLGIRVRGAEAGKPVKLKMTASRRGLLEAIAAGVVRWYPSYGWKSDGKGAAALVRDCVSAGWATEALDGDRRTIALTEAGRKAAGFDEVSA